MKAKCRTCGKMVGARFPKGGDGTAVIIRRHYSSTYPKPIKCPGSFDTVEAPLTTGTGGSDE